MRNRLLPRQFAGLVLGAALSGLCTAPAQSQPAAAIAAPVMAPSVRVEHAWARATPGGGHTAAVYLTLTASLTADQLVGATTSVAGEATVHETIDDHGVMKMRPIAGLPLPPGQPVSLAPGGYHLMLTELHGPLVAGTTFPVTLTFAHSAPLTITVSVGTLGAGAANSDHAKMAM